MSSLDSVTVAKFQSSHAFFVRSNSALAAAPLFNPICPISTVLELFFDRHQF